MLPVGPGGRAQGDGGDPDVGWRWWRPVLTSADAQRLAADHMRHLGFCGVFVRAGDPDAWTLLAIDAAALVRIHADSPCVIPRPLAEHRSQAPGAPRQHRLVYVASCARTVVEAASAQGVALFHFEPNGVVLAVNDHARSLVTQRYTPPALRTRLGRLTPFGRQLRAMSWLERLASPDVHAPVDSDDDGAPSPHDPRDLMVALAALREARGPGLARRDRTRSLRRAERALRKAAEGLDVHLG